MPTLKATPEEAMRLARAIVSDLLAYHGPKIEAGIRNDNLFEALSDEIQEGRDLYNSRVAPEVLSTTNFFDRALVDMVILPRANVKSRMW
jgi:hypothetical protein